MQFRRNRTQWLLWHIHFNSLLLTGDITCSLVFSTVTTRMMCCRLKSPVINWLLSGINDCCEMTVGWPLLTLCVKTVDLMCEDCWLFCVQTTRQWPSCGLPSHWVLSSARLLRYDIWQLRPHCTRHQGRPVRLWIILDHILAWVWRSWRSTSRYLKSCTHANSKIMCTTVPILSSVCTD